MLFHSKVCCFSKRNVVAVKFGGEQVQLLQYPSVHREHRPFCTTSSGLRPSLSTFFASAPAPSKTATLHDLPVFVAVCRGVSSRVPVAFTSAPALMSSIITAKCPLQAAQCNADDPSMWIRVPLCPLVVLFTHLAGYAAETFSPACIKARTAGKLSFQTAQKRGSRVS